LNLRGWQVLVVGGGKVALQKLRGLRDTGAIPRLVAPSILPQTSSVLKKFPGSSSSRRSFQDQDLRQVSLVFAATDSRVVNARVAGLALEKGLLVCVADQPGEGNFSLPAVAQAGPLSLAVSTDGASPALAKALRLRLERELKASGLPALARRLKALRPWLKAHPREKARLSRQIEGLFGTP
jgi:precorrin-2 dehydrogenase/sirohydrochlorin ferrochelatase